MPTQPIPSGRIELMLPLVLVLLGASCKTDFGTAVVQGRLAGATAEDQKHLQALSSKTPLTGNPAYSPADSQARALDGLVVELVELSNGDEKGLVDTAEPDAEGRFFFPEVPAIPHLKTSKTYHVRISQPPDALVTYGSGGVIRWLEKDEALFLSLPVVTRLHVPLWIGPGEAPDPDAGPAPVSLAADRLGNRLVYIHWDRGLGVYDPVRATVQTLSMESALYMPSDHAVHNYLEVVEEARLVLIALLSHWPGRPSRFILVDFEVFADPEVSKALDLDDPETMAGLEDLVTIIDIPEYDDFVGANTPYYHASSFRSIRAATADGKRMYHSEFVLDLENRELVGVINDGGILGAYNPVSGHLFFDMSGGLLRLRDASTGDVVGELDLEAKHMLGIATFPNQGRTLVSYEAHQGVTRDGKVYHHRMAIIAADGTVESDHLAGDLLGLPDRLFDPAYDWTGQGPEYYDGKDCPNCGPLPRDVFGPDHTENLHPLNMIFDPGRNMLVVAHGGQAFELRDGTFYPMPTLGWGRFGVPDECGGGTGDHYDAPNSVAIMIPHNTICLLRFGEPDLSVSLEAGGERLGPSAPAFLPELGIGFVPSADLITVIHYASPDAATQPAVRDFR